MIEFAPGYLQSRVPHLTRNYFPIATREPTQAMYENGARHNPATDPEAIRLRQFGRNLLTFFARSELALLASAAFGKQKDADKYRREINVGRAIKGMAEAIRLPYTTTPRTNLL